MTDQKCKANRLEEYYINLFNIIKNGYNNLQGSPGATKKFYCLRKKRKL